MGMRESEVLEAMGESQLAQVSTRVGQNKRISRQEALQMVEHNQSIVTGKLLYNDFQKIILDFQLEEHERFLANFTALWKNVDQQRNGYI